LNGEKIVGIVKPEEKRFDVFNILPIYLKVNKIAVLMDQEKEDINSIFNEVEKRLQRIGTVIERVDEESRLRVYSCRHGSKKFQLILIVNGLDEYNFKRHSIEDHLLKAAEKLLGSKVSTEDPKEGWKELKNIQDEIFENLKERCKIEDVFPQQVKGLKLLHG